MSRRLAHTRVPRCAAELWVLPLPSSLLRAIAGGGALVLRGVTCGRQDALLDPTSVRCVFTGWAPRPATAWRGLPLLRGAPRAMPSASSLSPWPLFLTRESPMGPRLLGQQIPHSHGGCCPWQGRAESAGVGQVGVRAPGQMCTSKHPRLRGSGPLSLPEPLPPQDAAENGTENRLPVGTARSLVSSPGPAGFGGRRILGPSKY